MQPRAKQNEKVLTALDREIAKVSAGIEALKKSGTPEVWRKEVPQLWRKEEQLQSKEEQLLEARLILMRQAAPE